MRHKNIFFTLITILFCIQIQAQSFDYKLDLKPVVIDSFPGIHSFAYGQHQGKWLLIGGRLDGLHARQPFNAFPQNKNNQNLYVIDIENNLFWSKPLTSLPVDIQEQLQSTNMNFIQVMDTLYIIGGYAYSNTQQDHITFDKLTTIIVSKTIDAIVQGNPITSHFKQISDANMAITGGQLGKIGSQFYLVGGHRFDGRYNPMGNATYTQTYSNQIRKFDINNSGNSINISNYSAITDPVHLRRRDYNLLPQIFPNGTHGYTISSGVFQPNVDLPFLYPVNIFDTGYHPVTNFNQYLSNYHSAKVCLYDSLENEMHTLFFGGMSQYYYQNGVLIQDNNVPFVKTISRLTRFSNGSLQEFQLTEEMPNLKGASAEFILNHELAHYESEIIKLNSVNADTILLGHIVGGILSNSLNPFVDNNTSSTLADNTIYEVRLIKNQLSNQIEIEGNHSYDFKLYPNPSDGVFYIEYQMDKMIDVDYFITSNDGKLIEKGVLKSKSNQLNKHKIQNSIKSDFAEITLIFDHKYFVSKKVMIKK